MLYFKKKTLVEPLQESSGSWEQLPAPTYPPHPPPTSKPAYSPSKQSRCSHARVGLREKCHWPYFPRSHLLPRLRRVQGVGGWDALEKEAPEALALWSCPKQARFKSSDMKRSTRAVGNSRILEGQLDTVAKTLPQVQSLA